MMKTFGKKAEGLRLYIYSSGSVRAQLLFFEFNADGDLRPLFSGHFDTDIGSKVETASYDRIAADMGAKPRSVVFFSDSMNEIKAARSAGFQTVHVVKDETPSDGDATEISDFSEISVVRAGTV